MSIRVISDREPLGYPDPLPHEVLRNQHGELVISAGYGLRQIAFVLDVEAERDLVAAGKSDRFEVNQLGAGFIPLGHWYWCRLGPDVPAEPISAHGPYLLRFLAVRAAREATNA